MLSGTEVLCKWMVVGFVVEFPIVGEISVEEFSTVTVVISGDERAVLVVLMGGEETVEK